MVCCLLSFWSKEANFRLILGLDMSLVGEELSVCSRVLCRGRLAMLCRSDVDMQVELRPYAFLLSGFEARRGTVPDSRFVIHSVVIVNTSCCILTLCDYSTLRQSECTDVSTLSLSQAI